MREIVHIQAGQCGNQIGAKVRRLTARLHNDRCVESFYCKFSGKPLVCFGPTRKNRD